MTIEDILQSGTPAQVVGMLKDKAVILPGWAGKDGLQQQYESERHPVMDKVHYPDIVHPDGMEKVTRIPLNFQKLAVKRMTELCCAIPVRRKYSPENERQQEVAKYIERIFAKTKINAVNNERLRMLFAGCEVMTLWYAVVQKNNLYGFESSLKLRCRNFSPMNGDELYPLFDETGDLIALSVGYRRKVGKRYIQYFDAYTHDRHILYSTEKGDWNVDADEKMELGKIPAIYIYRPEPIWEDTSELVYEMEWSLSRNGNYLRRNSKPLFTVMADEQIQYGEEKDEREEFRSIVQFPKGSTAQYVTWQQAIESLKYHVDSLRSFYFTQLQLPDWSYDKMSQQALSGESRKQLFIDAQLKVGDESYRLVEAFDREVNVLRTFLKLMLPGYDKEIDALMVENIITPFSITDDKDKVDVLMTATAGKPILSQLEAIETLGWSEDAMKSLEQINKEGNNDLFDEGYE